MTSVSCDHVTSFNYGDKKVRSVSLTCWYCFNPYSPYEPNCPSEHHERYPPPLNHNVLWISLFTRFFKIIIIIIIIIIFINNFFFVGIIQHFKILQIVFRLKKLIKFNYKPSKMKVLKDTFQQSFKLHIYWWELKKSTQTHILFFFYNDIQIHI